MNERGDVKETKSMGSSAAAHLWRVGSGSGGQADANERASNGGPTSRKQIVNNIGDCGDAVGVRGGESGTR